MAASSIPAIGTWGLIFVAGGHTGVAWWAWADWSGYTKKKAVQRENEKRQARIDKNKESLGIKTTRRR